MKKVLIIIAALLFLASCQQPTVEEVIRKSQQKCQSIESGHYEMTQLMKYMSENDTTFTKHICDFKKVPNDTIYGKYFAMFSEGSDWTYHNLYTGKEAVAYDDSIGTITSCDLWADKIMAVRHNRTFYTPLTDKNCYPLLTEEDFADSTLTYSLTETQLENKPCYLVDYFWTNLEPNTIFGIQNIRHEVNLWIDKDNYLPVKYSIADDIVQQGDTLHQYEECQLDTFKEEADMSLIDLQAIPSQVILKAYVPYKAPEPLKEGEAVPQWSLESIDGTMVSLADLKGKIVLLDFFYQSCAPCCAALPGLQKLHEKYADKGFAMIGINPYDTKEEMTEFLNKRGITYTVLLSDGSLPKEYRVDGYPNLFLIDREGKLIKLFEGFWKNMDEEIETELLKML